LEYALASLKRATSFIRPTTSSPVTFWLFERIEFQFANNATMASIIAESDQKTKAQIPGNRHGVIGIAVVLPRGDFLDEGLFVGSAAIEVGRLAIHHQKSSPQTQASIPGNLSESGD
jgi:hypothetical protein